jgi:hypothetical protein
MEPVVSVLKVSFYNYLVHRLFVKNVELVAKPARTQKTVWYANMDSL